MCNALVSIITPCYNGEKWIARLMDSVLNQTYSNIEFIIVNDGSKDRTQQIAEELGYKLHARMIWNKVTGIPAAFTVRYGHEYLLYMYKGKLPPVALEERGKIHTVFTEKVQRHSQKPEISYEIINRLYPDLKKLEMYARTERDKFDCWGNEVPVLED